MVEFIVGALVFMTGALFGASIGHTKREQKELPPPKQ